MTASNRIISRVVKALVAGGLGVTLLGAGSPANADSTCNTLVSNLISKALTCSNCVVAHHTTNFITVVNGVVTHPRFGGYTDATLNYADGHLFGSGFRLHSDRLTASGQPFDLNQSESISYDISQFGKLVMDGQYGPYDPVCYFDQFMVVPGATAVEVFSFEFVSP